MLKFARQMQCRMTPIETLEFELASLYVSFRAEKAFVPSLAKNGLGAQKRVG